MDPIAITSTTTSLGADGITFATILIALEVMTVAVFLSVLAAGLVGRVRRGRALLVPLAAALPHLPGWALVILYHVWREQTGWTWDGDALAVGMMVLAASVVAAVLVWSRRRTVGSLRPWALATAVITIITIISWHQASQAARVEDQVLGARAGAVLAALRPGMPAPADNAAVDIVRAIELKAAMVAAGATEAAESVAAGSPLLVMIEAAVEKPVLAMPRNLIVPMVSMTLPEIEILRQGANALAARARDRMAQGDMRGAWEDATRIHRLADLAEQEPILISQLVAASVRASGFTVMSECALRDPDWLTSASRPGWGWRQRLDQAMIVEEAIGLQAVLHDPESNFELLSGTSYGITPRLLWPVYRLVLMRRDVAGYRNGLHRMRTSLGNGLAGLSRAADDARSGLIDDMLRPAIFLCAKSMATADAQAAVMAAGGAAVAYRKKTGAWPTAAGADWPQDPCDSRPLRMQAVEDRLRIWSVGSNLKDDGGVSGGKDRLAGDVVLELRPPR